MNTNVGMLVQPHVNIDLAAYFGEGDQAMSIFFGCLTALQLLFK
jgi:hypothetical protein